MYMVELEHKLGLKGGTVKIYENEKLTVVREDINKLLNRLEVDVYIEHTTSSTPSRDSLRRAIANIYRVPQELVVVKSISTEYGVGVSKAHIHIYADHDTMRKVELKHILKRNNIQV